MTVRSNATAVGAFVLGALAIAVGIAVVFGSGLLFKDVTRYVIYFEGSLEGLGVGAPVKYRGVQIGQVVSITPSFEKQKRSINIPVVIELTRDAVEGVERGGKAMEVLTKEGLRARLELASLITGQLNVGLDIFPGTPIREVSNRTDYRQIRSVPSLQIGLQQSLSDLVAEPRQAGQGPRLDARAIELHDGRRRGPGLRRGGALDGPAGGSPGRSEGGRWWRRSASCLA